MDYSELASELLSVRANLLQVPASQLLSRMEKGEWFVLNYLLTHKTVIHPKELSEKMSVSTARIASLLNHMEEKGWILRTADSEDNRQIIVRLTEEGKHEVDQARNETITYAAKMLESLGPEDAREYIRIQEKIWKNYRKQG